MVELLSTLINFMYSNIKGQEGKIGNLPDFDLFLSWPLGCWKGYINITGFFFAEATTCILNFDNLFGSE